MDKLFFLKALLSFIVGSLWITLATVFAEKYGTKIGGIIAGLPSTILISLFFIGWTQSPDIAVSATTIVPFVGGINCLFIVAYVLLAGVNFWVAIAGSLALWTVLSSMLVFMKLQNFSVSLGAYIGLLLLSHYILEKRLRIPSKTGIRVKYTPFVVIWRALFSGFIILSAVVMAMIGGPLVGGMFAMFPAMFIGAIFITHFAHGAGFSSAVMKASLLGATSVVVYGIAVRYTYIPLGLFTGTAVSMLIALVNACLVHQLVIKKTI